MTLLRIAEYLDGPGFPLLCAALGVWAFVCLGVSYEMRFW
jgi:hypothetical protein